MRKHINPLVSIIMPVFNVEDYLKESIDSIIGQTYQNFELLIINDGSTDGSLDIAKQYLNDKRIKIFNTSNRGVSYARNVGICAAVGDYLYFSDPDDFLDISLLSIVLNKMILSKSQLALFNFNLVDEQSEKIAGAFKIQIKEGVYSSEKIMKNYLQGDIQNYPWSYIVQRNVIKDNEIYFPVGRVFEDLAIFPHIIFHAATISIISDSLYNYRVRHDSITVADTGSALKLADYATNLINNEKWLHNYYIVNLKKELSVYFINNFLQIYLTSARDKNLKYFDTITLSIEKIKEYFRINNGKGLSKKRWIIVLIIWLGQGKLMYNVIAFLAMVKNRVGIS